jgi:hypothetical protein
LANRLDQEAFAHAALSDQDDVVVAANELGGGQFLDLGAVNRAIEVPIKAGQGLGLAETGLTDAMGDAAFAAQVGLLGDHQVQELQMRQTLAIGARQGGVECLGRQGDLERGEVGQDLFTQVGSCRAV